MIDVDVSCYAADVYCGRHRRTPPFDVNDNLGYYELTLFMLYIFDLLLSLLKSHLIKHKHNYQDVYVNTNNAYIAHPQRAIPSIRGRPGAGSLCHFVFE